MQDIFSSSMAKHLGVQVLPAAEIDPTPCVYFSRETNEGSGLDELQAITAAEKRVNLDRVRAHLKHYLSELDKIVAVAPVEQLQAMAGEDMELGEGDLNRTPELSEGDSASDDEGEQSPGVATEPLREAAQAGARILNQAVGR